MGYEGTALDHRVTPGTRIRIITETRTPTPLAVLLACLRVAELVHGQLVVHRGIEPVGQLFRCDAGLGEQQVLGPAPRRRQC